MSVSNIPPIAKQLQQEMFVGLHDRIAVDTDEYERFLCVLEGVGLLPGEISRCRNILQILQLLDSREKISVGNYDTLKSILKSAKLGEALNFVKASEQAIRQTMGSAGMPEAAPSSQASAPMPLTGCQTQTIGDFSGASIQGAGNVINVIGYQFNTRPVESGEPDSQTNYLPSKTSKSIFANDLNPRSFPIERELAVLENSKVDDNIAVLRRLALAFKYSTVSDMQKYINDNGGVVPVLLAMKLHNEDQNVQAIGCFTIARICEGVENINIIHDSGGTDLVISAMRTHECSECVQCRGCVVLSRMSEVRAPDLRRHIFDNGGVTRVLSAMERFSGSLDVQRHGCFTLACLSMSGIDIPIQTGIHDKGGVNRVLSAMKHHNSDSGVQYFGCHALASIAEGIPTIQNYIFVNGGVDLVLMAIDTFVDDRDVPTGVCGVLANVSEGVPKIQRYINNNGGVTLVLSAMEKNVCNGVLQLNGCLALACISHGISDIQKNIFDSDGVDRVLSAMRIHEDNGKVQGNACLALAYIAQDDPDIQKYILQKRGEFQIISAFQKHHNYMGVQNSASLALNALNQH